MIAQHEIRLALPADADAIARMSRDFIEYGLGWRWTPERIAGCMRDAATNVVVVDDANGIAGFLDGKLKSPEMQQWDWNGYMVDQYPKFPKRKLFEKEYEEMFSDLYRAEEAQS